VNHNDGGRREAFDLAGDWRFRLDPDGQGIDARWWDEPLPDTAHLPGSTDENGYGDEPTERDRDKLTRLHKYVGPAWYQRDVVIPANWQGKRITLFLERCHWESRVWLDGVPLGMQDSLCVPHVYDLPDTLPVGQHRLTIRVDNTIKYPVGELRGTDLQVAHSVTDHTQTNWNGIIGQIALVATDPIWLDDLQVFSDIHAKSVRLVATISNTTGQPAQGTLSLTAHALQATPPTDPAAAEAVSGAWPVTIGPAPRTVTEAVLPMGDDVRLWDDIEPVPLTLTASLTAKQGEHTYVDRQTTQFGMREFSAQGSQLTLNGRPTFLRGTVECAVFPLTGYPPMDLQAWLREFAMAKSLGLNCFRFHSWCPPEAAFDAADRLGFMLHIETPVWTYLGEYPDLDQFVYDEGDRILRLYGNHPSFCMLLAGNEPHGQNVEPFLTGLLEHWKAKDNRRLYSGCSGWPEIPANQFHVLPRRHGKGPLRAHAFVGSRLDAEPPRTDADYRFHIADAPVPIVAHEIGQWCVYPNLDEIDKFRGVLRAVNYEIFRDSLAEHHMLDQAHAFTMASGALQLREYKEEIESALRTPGYGGFEIVFINDCHGEGTAVIGVLDAFWDPKPYLDPDKFASFCASTVPLARMTKLTWTTDETFTADVELAHFGRAPIDAAVPTWSLSLADGQEIASCKLPPRSIPVGNGIALGTIRMPLAGVPAPAKLVLTVGLEGTPFRNDWEIWVYPSCVDTTPPEGVLIASPGGVEVMEALERGEKVFLMPQLSALPDDIPAGFTTIFWNTNWFKQQPRRTLGILCDPTHPALAEFPTEYHSNWQWWDLVTKAGVLKLEAFPPEFRPIVQVIDDWNTNRKLGLLFEARVGEGRVLYCSVDLFNGLERRPVARQLLHSLFSYMRSDAFDPKTEVGLDVIASL